MIKPLKHLRPKARGHQQRIEDLARAGDDGPPGSGGAFDRGLMARRLAGAWLRQATIGQAVVFGYRAGRNRFIGG